MCGNDLAYGRFRPARSEEKHIMPIILWLLGVPVSVLVVLWLIGVF